MTNGEKDISIVGGDLLVEGNRIKFGHRITDFIKWDNDQLIIRFKPPGKGTPDRDRNVISLDSKGNMIWQISKPTSPPAHDSNPFMYIGKENGELWAECYWGPAYKVDPENGAFIGKEDVK